MICREIGETASVMGDTIWVNVERRSQADVPRDCTMMLKFGRALDRISAKLRVARLSTFYDHSEVEKQYAEFAEETLGRFAFVLHGLRFVLFRRPRQRGEVWFEPAKALVAVRAIQSHISQHPDALGLKAGVHVRNISHLIGDLEHARQVLEGAVATGKRFRFLIVP